MLTSYDNLDEITDEQLLKALEEPKEPEEPEEPEDAEKPEEPEEPEDPDAHKSVKINPNPCYEKEILNKEKNKIMNEINKLTKECEKEEFKEIYEYFDKKEKDKITNNDLLKALQKFYIYNKDNDFQYNLYFSEFINKFPRDTMPIFNFKKQHVFESICKILLLFNYDNFSLGKNKQFYSSLEEFIKNPYSSSVKISKNDILDSKINEGSKSGIVDIFFESNFDSSKLKKCHGDWVCDCLDESLVPPSKNTKEFILIQNKFFTNEKSINKNYDVTQIYATAEKLYEINPAISKQIILMVNNKQLLDNKITKTKNKLNLVDDIYGIKELEDWFRQLLNDLYETKTIEKYKEKVNLKSNLKEILSPLFHQKLITDLTLNYNNTGIQSNDYKLFIWGAVPRSGKSYIIANFIANSRLRKTSEQNNNILIILGAKTETEKQFYDMFEKYAEFNNYGIITASQGYFKEKNIFLLSQEWFKDKITTVKNDFRSATFKTKTTKKATDLLEKIKEKNIDLYFDEIHKGGATDNSESIFQTLINNKIKIDIFIMVSATYAKPNLRYNSLIDIDTNKKGIKLIEWSYEDQQNMKQVINTTNEENVINSREDPIEKQSIKNVFDYYKNKYGTDNYLQIISNEYINHPELVILQPDLLDREQNINISNIFFNNLKCNACKIEQSLTELKNPENIFSDIGRVRDLINFIGNFSDDKVTLDKTSVYYYLHKLNAPVSELHSEIWFLPDKDLYLEPEECNKNICKNIDKESDYDEENEEKSLRTNLPNIEALTRGLSFLLLQNTYFQSKYNILIVHNSEPKYIDKDTKNIITQNKIFQDNNQIYHIYKTTNLSQTIKDTETDSYKKGKSLIIF